MPVTVRELSELYLKYYKLKNKTELDKMLYAQLEKEIAELSEEELNAPAFSGHDTHFVLKANGKGEGLQFVRFNPDYWDRSLPPSAIQFMTFSYPQLDEVVLDESFKNNGYPKYSQLLVNEIDWGKLAKEMIVGKR
jgi:ABC-type transport system substrate-binding protein